MFETIRREMKELVGLVRRTTEWDMPIAHGRWTWTPCRRKHWPLIVQIPHASQS